MENQLLISVGDKIKIFRKAKNITQYRLAIQLDMSQSNLARIENGNTNITLLTLEKIAKQLDIEIKLLVI